MSDKINNIEKIVKAVSELSVLELSELVTALQDKLGVSATIPMAAPAVASTGSGEAQQAEAATGGGTVILTNAGGNKIAVIKALREINPNLGLKEAKDMTEQVPAEVLKDAKPDDAKQAVEKLKAAGATVETK